MSHVKIIIDTDIGADCDDAGALAIANALHNNGEIQLLGITHCTSDIDGAYTICAINRYYSNEDIPVGQTAVKGFLDGEENKTFTRRIKNNFVEKYGERDFEDAVPLLRKLLSENTNVRLVCIGQLNNLAALLRSKADDISTLDGQALAKQSLEKVIVMGGDFREGIPEAEYNIKCDIASAGYAAEKCPVPVVYCGFEAGTDVITGQPLKNADTDNPVRIAYEMFAEKYNDNIPFFRPSWDLVTVYYAAAGEIGLWKLSPAITVNFDENGLTVVKPGGKDRFLINAADTNEIVSVLNKFLQN